MAEIEDFLGVRLKYTEPHPHFFLNFCRVQNPNFAPRRISPDSSTDSLKKCHVYSLFSLRPDLAPAWAPTLRKPWSH
ncbi:hypothetical protein FYZ42_03545 [Mobiluncus mulieris]|nr:hypothetical protein [Mobiluncus mulieris]MCV0001827.1 hypothetical protein [Mobiluncus mulieris]